MYCAYITTIKELRKHSNADRLQCATIFGSNVIVDMSYAAGDRVIYFPVDGQLSVEFANDNNLVRKKDENGNNIGGYLDPDKRNIKALMLRGEKSDGLVLPIIVLAKYTDVEKLEDGAQITELNGHLICKKYIPRSNKRRHATGVKVAKNKKEEGLKVAYPYFMEHRDTEQLAYNQSAFKPGDTVYLTRKLHGCFNAKTRVKLWGERKAKPISQIVPGDVVVGYKDGKFVPSKVLDTYINGTTTEWHHIKIKRHGLCGEKVCNIKCTPNHKFYDYKTNGYIEAENITPNMKIGIIKPTYLLTREHKEFLLGMYLGDSCYAKRTNAAKLEFSAKESMAEYLDYLGNALGEIFYGLDDKDYVSGYGTKMRRGKTRELASIYNYFESILSNDSENKLTDKVVDYFSELSLAVLYMDDGSLSHHESQKDRANFAICDYNEHDSKIIADCFSKLGLNAVLYKDPRGYYRIRLNHLDAYKMFDMIASYIPPVMRYKLPAEYRNRDFVAPKFNTEFGYEFIESHVLSNKIEHCARNRKYDLHTETLNYVVGDVLVHNSSGRVANTLEITTKKRYRIIKRLFGVKDKESKKYQIVSGSRRVVLRNFDGGFYGSNKFREKYNTFFADKLPKGFTVYFEIVGWVNENTPIMARCQNSKVKNKDFSKRYGKETVFTYGCEPGENHAYVYRITVTNEDGVTVDLPTEEVMRWCEIWGCDYVPLLDKFLYTTWEDLIERCEKHLDVPEPLANGSHVVEGVVARIDNRGQFTAYKMKSWAFKVLESIIKDEADAPDMEEAESLISEDIENECCGN